MNSKYYNILRVNENTCKILLYGCVSSFKEDVNSKGFAVDFANAEATYENIEIRINSAGGDVFEGVAIFNMIRASEANVTIYIDGLAASIAGIIAMCGKPVKMNRYAMLMLHRVSGGSYGNADKIHQAAQDMEKVEGILINILSESMGITSDEIKTKYMDGNDHWISAEEAKAAGLVNEIYDGAKVVLPKTGEINAEKLANTFNNLLIHKQMKILWKKLGLKNEADEAQAVSAVEQFEAELQSANDLNKTQQTEIAALKARIQTFEDKAKADRDQQITALLDSAVQNGKIQETQRQTFKAMLDNDFDNGKAVIEAIQAPQRMIDMINTQNQGERKDWTFSDYQRRDPRGLETLKAEAPDVFKALYKNEFGTEINI